MSWRRGRGGFWPYAERLLFPKRSVNQLKISRIDRQLTASTEHWRRRRSGVLGRIMIMFITVG